MRPSTTPSATTSRDGRATGNRRRVDERRRRAPVGREAVEHAFEVVERPQVQLQEEAVLAGDAVALDDLRDLARDVPDPLELPARRGHPHDGGDRIADRARIDARVVARDHAEPLQTLHPLPDGRRGEVDPASELGDRDASVQLQLADDPSVDLVE